MSRSPDYPASIESLLGVLCWQRDRQPERVACHRIVRDRAGLRADPLSVAALLDRAAVAAASLRAAGAGAGDRIVLAISDPHDFLVAFTAVLILGAQAVPLPPVAEAGAPRSFATRLRSVVADCAPVVVIVEDAETLRRVLGTVPAGLRVLEPGDLAGAERLPIDDRPAATPAFIQYTSGSTGAPKGVVVTHGNLLANCRAIRDATGYTTADRMVSWLPLHHDMGLVGGLLTSLYCAAETWLMPPLAFLGRPVTWLEAIGAFRATLTVGPTFAYGLCARKLPERQLAGVDLSSLRLAYIGAEPIAPSIAQAFVARFAPYGLRPEALYPVYGLAEATLAVTFPAPGTAIREDRIDRRRLATEGQAAPVDPTHRDALVLVSVGHPLPGHQVTIRCPDTGAPAGDRRVGEIVVEGPSVTPGYFGAAAATARTHLCTGDLGYTADGHLYVVDRIKDLVIVGGLNYAPSDIEQALMGVAGLRGGRAVAFSAPDADGLDALHVVAEANPDAPRAAAEIAADVRGAVRREIGIAVTTVTVVAPGTLERTSSGKLRRQACAAAHRAGTLVPFAQAEP